MAGDEHQAQSDHEETAGWQYTPGNAAAPLTGADPTAPLSGASSEGVEWTASEFIAHDKSWAWYAVLGLATLLIATLTYLVTNDRFSTLAMLVFGAIIGVTGARKPRTVTYRLGAHGVQVGRQFHPFNEYKSFVVRHELPFISLELVPMKRFALPRSLYLAPENEAEVIEALSHHLPLEHKQPDGFDELMHRLRF